MDKHKSVDKCMSVIKPNRYQQMHDRYFIEN